MKRLHIGIVDSTRIHSVVTNLTRHEQLEVGIFIPALGFGDKHNLLLLPDLKTTIEYYSNANLEQDMAQYVKGINHFRDVLEFHKLENFSGLVNKLVICLVDENKDKILETDFMADFRNGLAIKTVLKEGDEDE